MRVLIAAATAGEIAPLIGYLAANRGRSEGQNRFARHETLINILITGVGMLAATAALTKACCGSDLPDLLVLAGIAGTFDRNISPGEIVIIKEDAVGDLGAEDGEEFLTLADIGLQKEEEVRIAARMPVIPAFQNIRHVSGITVNTVTGSAATALRRQRLFNAHIETMEGAAAHYVAREADIPLLHIRAISNYVERRNRAAWKIPEAIAALNKTLIDWISGSSAIEEKDTDAM